MNLVFIGLGNMGMPMAKNLVAAGYRVYGRNRSKAPEEAFSKAGGIGGLSLEELAQRGDVIMTCLPLPRDVEDVFFGEKGIVANGGPGKVLIDFSTVSPDLNRRVSEEAGKRGMDFLDAPVSGGNFGAAAGTLSIMVGGKKEAFEKVLPILEVLGKNIYHTGGVGSGTAVKLINQYLVSVHTQAVGEALVLADSLGMDKEALFNILNASYAQSRIFERHYENFIAKNQFEPGFALELLHKDIGLVQEMAVGQKVKMPFGEYALEMLAKAKASEHAGKDMSAMYLFIRDMQDNHTKEGL